LSQIIIQGTAASIRILQHRKDVACWLLSEQYLTSSRLFHDFRSVSTGFVRYFRTVRIKLTAYH